MLVLIGWGWGTAAMLMAILWLRQRQSRDATSVDVAWAATIGALAIGFALLSRGDLWRRGLVALLAAGWAFRLARHLWRDRAASARGEDGRYAALRSSWGRQADRNFFWLYQAQAAAATLFAIPLLAAMQGGAPGRIALVGVAVWLVAVAGESIADDQLARFRADPAHRGQVCRVGFWYYSRHPNYFFEWLHWWAYVLIGGGAWLTLLGPIAMWLFVYRLTGIPYTEAQALRSRGDAYREYQRTTNAFLPWRPHP